MYRSIIITAAAVIAFTINTGQAAAHPHVAGPTDQSVANGQNHPGFQPVNDDGLRLSCQGVLEPADAGPAGYGLETAHHGPDAGDPGKADSCYAVVGNPQDHNQPSTDQERLGSQVLPTRTDIDAEMVRPRPASGPVFVLLRAVDELENSHAAEPNALQHGRASALGTTRQCSLIKHVRAMSARSRAALRPSPGNSPGRVKRQAARRHA